MHAGGIKAVLPDKLLAFWRVRAWREYLRSTSKEQKKKGKTKILSRAIRAKTLSGLRAQTLIVQFHKRDAESGKVLCVEMGSSQSTCPKRVMDTLLKRNLLLTKVFRAKILKSQSVTHVTINLWGFEYPITGVLGGEGEDLVGKRFKYGQEIRVQLAGLTRANQLEVVLPGGNRSPALSPAEEVETIPETNETISEINKPRSAEVTMLGEFKARLKEVKARRRKEGVADMEAPEEPTDGL